MCLFRSHSLNLVSPCNDNLNFQLTIPFFFFDIFQLYENGIMLYTFFHGFILSWRVMRLRFSHNMRFIHFCKFCIFFNRRESALSKWSLLCHIFSKNSPSFSHLVTYSCQVVHAVTYSYFIKANMTYPGLVERLSEAITINHKQKKNL